MTTSDINQIQGSSPDLKTELARQLAELVPEAMTDGKVDVAKIRELLADDAGDENERFGLFWPGKRRAMRAAQEPTSATLRPMKDQSKDWDTTQNVFIEGDNLEVLKVLQKHYHNKVKMIYIDPPYNTGKDFIYPDNYKEGLANYLEFTSQLNESGQRRTSNSETDGRYHSNWLTMMYPRLKLARNLLTDDGLVFASIDDHEYDNLKKLLDSVFGESNYLNTFVWVSNLKGRQITGRGAAGTKEYVLCYAKRADEIGELRGSSSFAKKLMPTVYKGFDYVVEEDDHGPYVLKNELYNTNSAFNEATRPNLVFDIYYRTSDGDIITEDVSDRHLHEGYEKISPKKNNNGRNRYHAYRWSRKKISEEPHNLKFVRGDSGLRLYTKVRDVDTTTLKDLIMDISTTGGSRDVADSGLDPKSFDYPKPVDLVEMFVSMTTDPGSLVLDFFAGSGTTGHAVMRANARDGGDRRFILVQLPEPVDGGSAGTKGEVSTISGLARQRLVGAGAHVAEAPQAGQPVDTGFRAYELCDTQFNKWRAVSDETPEELSQQLLELRESANNNAKPEALLTELLLKQGFSLTENVESVQLGGLQTWRVAGGDVVAYLDEHTKPSLDQLRALAEAGAHRLIVLEDAFQGDDELKTNLVQLCKTHGVELWTA